MELLVLHQVPPQVADWEIPQIIKSLGQTKTSMTQGSNCGITNSRPLKNGFFKGLDWKICMRTSHLDSSGCETAVRKAMENYRTNYFSQDNHMAENSKPVAISPGHLFSGEKM